MGYEVSDTNPLVGPGSICIVSGWMDSWDKVEIKSINISNRSVAWMSAEQLQVLHDVRVRYRFIHMPY